MEACEGSVSGTVAYAWRNRRPRAASALKAGVSAPAASGPIASARVVSSVTRRIDGRAAAAAGPGVGDEAREHAIVMSDTNTTHAKGLSIDGETVSNRPAGIVMALWRTTDALLHHPDCAPGCFGDCGWPGGGGTDEHADHVVSETTGDRTARSGARRARCR